MNPLAALIASLTGTSAAGGLGVQQTQSSESGLFARLLGTDGELAIGAIGTTGEAGQAGLPGPFAVPEASATGVAEVNASITALLSVDDETVVLPGVTAPENAVAETAPAAAAPDAPEQTVPETTPLELVELVPGDAEAAPVEPAAEETAEPASSDDNSDSDNEAQNDTVSDPVAVAAPHLTGLDNALQKAGDGPGATGLERAVARAGEAPGQTRAPVTPTPSAGAGAQQPPAQGTATPQPAPAATDTGIGPAQGSKTGDASGQDTARQPVAAASRQPQVAPEHNEARGRRGADIPRPVRILTSAVNPATGQRLVQIRESKELDGKGLVALDPGTASVQLRAGPAAPTPAASQAPQIPVNALAVHIAQQAQNGAKRFDIRLDPPELGRVEIRLDVTREGHVTTHLVVERSETLDLLQRDARQLERALQNAGLDTSEGGMKFSLKDQGLAQHMPRGGYEASGGAESASDADAADTSIEPLDALPRGRMYVAREGLDIRI